MKLRCLRSEHISILFQILNKNNEYNTEKRTKLIDHKFMFIILLNGNCATIWEELYVTAAWLYDCVLK